MFLILTLLVTFVISELYIKMLSSTLRKQFIVALLTSQIPSPFSPLAASDNSLDSVHINFSALPLLLSLSSPTLALPTSCYTSSNHDHDDDQYEFYSTHITGGGQQSLHTPFTSSTLLSPILEYALYYPP